MKITENQIKVVKTMEGCGLITSTADEVVDLIETTYLDEFETLTNAKEIDQNGSCYLISSLKAKYVEKLANTSDLEDLMRSWLEDTYNLQEMSDFEDFLDELSGYEAFYLGKDYSENFSEYDDWFIYEDGEVKSWSDIEDAFDDMGGDLEDLIADVDVGNEYEDLIADTLRVLEVLCICKEYKESEDIKDLQNELKLDEGDANE